MSAYGPDVFNEPSDANMHVLPDPRRLIVSGADELKMKPMLWLWRPWLPRGMLSLLGGQQGIGKGAMLYDLAGRITRGDQLPCGGAAAPVGSVVWLGYEEDPERVIVPRLTAANAILKRVKIVRGRWSCGRAIPVALPDDIDAVAKLIRELGDVRLVVIDPLVSSFGGRVQLNKAERVRPVLHALVDLAEESGAAVVGVSHLRKNESNDALYRIAGSSAFTEVARAVNAIGRVEGDPDVRLLGQIKTNGPGVKCDLAFRLVPVELGGEGEDRIEAVRVEWIGEWQGTSVAEGLSAPNTGKLTRGTRFSAAVKFLQTALASGPRPSAEVESAAESAGIKSRTFSDARSELRIESYLSAGIGSPHMMRLPEARAAGRAPA